MFLRLVYLFICLSAILSTSAVSAEVDGAYKLNQGDILFISVWGKDTLQKEVKVLPDASISFPLVGRIDVTNASTQDVEKRVAEKLKTYLSDPQVTVLVNGIEGNKFYILGKVIKSGPFLLNGPMTVLQAISFAGGLDKFADTSEIKVLRNGSKGQIAIPVNYNSLIKGQNLESNIAIHTGDTILVP